MVHGRARDFASKIYTAPILQTEDLFGTSISNQGFIWHLHCKPSNLSPLFRKPCLSRHLFIPPSTLNFMTITHTHHFLSSFTHGLVGSTPSKPTRKRSFWRRCAQTTHTLGPPALMMETRVLAILIHTTPPRKRGP